MTTFHDKDWRISSTSKIIRTLSDSINDIYRNREGEKDIYRTKEETGLIDELIGISFIVVQIYVNGTLADIKLIK